MDTELARQSFLLCFTALAAWFDVKCRRIPNWLSLAGFAAGVGWLLLVPPSVPEFGRWWLAPLIGVGSMFLLYLLGGVGGGDVKMLAGFSLLAGYPGIIYYLFFGSLAAGALMLAPLAWRGELTARLRSGLRLRAKDADLEQARQPVATSFALALLIAVVWVAIMEAL